MPKEWPLQQIQMRPGRWGPGPRKSYRRSDRPSSRDFAPVGAVIGRATNLVPGVGRHLASKANVAVQGVLVHDVSKAGDH